MYSFYVSKQEEIRILNEMLVGVEVCTKEERAKQYHIPLEIAQKCQEQKEPPKELIDFVNKAYQEKAADLQKAVTVHRDFWHKNGAKIRKILSELLEQKIPHFNVLLSVLCAGISDWEGTNISVNAFSYQNCSAWYSIVLWETILALTFQRIRKKYSQKIYSDEVVWAVAEMTSCAIINTDFDVTWNIGYRLLTPHQEKVIKTYKNR